MAKRRKAPPPKRRPTAVIAGAAVVVAAAIGLAALLLLRPAVSDAPIAWAKFGSADVHSLAFVGDDTQHLLFGHHGGLEETKDGGRTWSRLPVRDDAMSMSPASDASIVIAGHDVFVASRDGGQTWAPIKGDLPSLDIHGFTRDPADPVRMWAYLAIGGLWESTDSGAHFQRVRDDNVLFPTAVRDGTTTRLFGVDANGLSASDDGGRTWTGLVSPPTFPMIAFAASVDGRVLYAGATDGLFRSGDGGRSWAKTRYSGSAFAIATTADAHTVAVVNRETEFFRSADGGATWPAPD